MRANFHRWISIFSVIFLSLSLLLILLLGMVNLPLSEVSLVAFASLYFCAWIPLLFFSAVWLIFVNKDYLGNTLVWIGFQIVFGLVLLCSQIPISSISFLSVSLFLILFPLLGIINYFYAFKRSFSLRLVSLGSIGFVWSILLAWRIQGNLLEKWMTSLISNNNDLLWLNALMIITGWMFFSGIVCFVVETIQSFVCEFSASFPKTTE